MDEILWGDEESDEEFFDEILLKVAILEATEDDAPQQDPNAQVQIYDVQRTTRPGGAGTGRPDRAAPNAYLVDIQGNVISRRHFGIESPWGRLYFNPISPPRPGIGTWAMFRRKFRTPWPLFQMILDDCFQDGRFGNDEQPANGGHQPTPLCLKIAAYFRYLATGAQVDAHEESSGCARTTLQKFFPAFGNYFVEKYYDVWVRMPETEEELRRLEKPFRLCGLPGCVTSMDGVHVCWDRCPSSLRPDHTGKEGYPTLAWNVNVSHNGKIQNCHGHRRVQGAPLELGFRGAINDKTMSRSDRMVTALGTNPLFKNFEYELLSSSDGARIRLKGAYGVNDGGYHNWLHTIAGTKADQAATQVEDFWSGTCESIRKDSERVFGVAKKRHRILRLPFLQHRAIDIDTIMKVCCILHNMLLQYDGLDTIGDLDTDYMVRDGNENEDIDLGLADFTDAELREEAETDDPRSRFTEEEQRARRPSSIPVTPDTDVLLIGSQCLNPSSETTEKHDGYEEKRKLLWTHHSHAWERRELLWLKKASECRPHHLRDPYGAPGPWRR